MTRKHNNNDNNSHQNTILIWLQSLSHVLCIMSNSFCSRSKERVRLRVYRQRTHTPNVVSHTALIDFHKRGYQENPSSVGIITATVIIIMWCNST